MQLLRNPRVAKKQKFKTPALLGNPQIKGVCNRIFNKTPRKPNSALRKVAKIKLRTKKFVFGYIPGEKHNLQEHSLILLRGGTVKDLPGMKYKLIRGKYDFGGVIGRIHGRSCYGVKKKLKIK